MNKVELAKMLNLDYDRSVPNQKLLPPYELFKLVGAKVPIKKSFLSAEIKVEVTLDDLTKDKLDINPKDLVEQCDIAVCVKQVEDLIWERAADIYLKRVHRAAMLIGGDE